jgi:hypothetical protein
MMQGRLAIPGPQDNKRRTVLRHVHFVTFAAERNPMLRSLWLWEDRLVPWLGKTG